MAQVGGAQASSSFLANTLNGLQQGGYGQVTALYLNAADENVTGWQDAANNNPLSAQAHFANCNQTLQYAHSQGRCDYDA